MLRVNNFQGDSLNLADVLRIAPQIEAKYERTRIQTGDVLLTIVGTVGQVAIAPEALNGWNIARAVAMIRPKEPELSRWISFVLRSPAAQHQLGVAANTTVQTTINLKDLRSLQIPLPDKNTRIAVSEALGALDDRIDNLRQTNATLAAIAAALFKSWFVSFDGIAKEDMQESELGLIPKGWRVGSAYDIANVRYGAPFASSKFNTACNGLPLVRIRDLRNESPGVWTPEVHPKGYLIQPGDIIVGMDGEFRAYLWGGESAWMNQRVCAFHPKKPHCAAFVHNAIAPHLAQVEATEVATTVIHLGKGDIDEFRFVVPSDEVASNFAASCQPLYDRIVTNKQQAATLATIRDTLLPRLISDKLRIGEAARMAAESA